MVGWALRENSKLTRAREGVRVDLGGGVFAFDLVVLVDSEFRADCGLLASGPALAVRSGGEGREEGEEGKVEEPAL